MATTSNYGWPTPDDTDLVRDGAAAIRDLGSAIDASLAQSIVQVVNLTFTTAFTTTSNAAITGYTLSITPTSATNKVLVVMNAALSGSGGLRHRIQGRRTIGATTIALPEVNDTAAGGFGYVDPSSRNNTEFNENKLLVFLDSPATTSTVTYFGFGILDSGGTLTLNRAAAASTRGGVSSITLLEVKA